MKLELVSNASEWGKMYSVQVFLFIEVMGIWQVVSPLVSWALPDWLLGVATMLVALAGIFARLVKQFNLTPKEAS
jgi:hypothetical protein